MSVIFSKGATFVNQVQVYDDGLKAVLLSALPALDDYGFVDFDTGEALLRDSTPVTLSSLPNPESEVIALPMVADILDGNVHITFPPTSSSLEEVASDLLAQAIDSGLRLKRAAFLDMLADNGFLPYVESAVQSARDAGHEGLATALWKEINTRETFSLGGFKLRLATLKVTGILPAEVDTSDAVIEVMWTNAVS